MGGRIRRTIRIPSWGFRSSRDIKNPRPGIFSCLRLAGRANVAQGAIRTTGFSRETPVPSEEHERMVRADLLLDAEFLFYGTVGFLRSFGFYDLEAVEHAVDVGIHSDEGKVVEHGEHDLRRLDAHAGKRADIADILGDFSMEIPRELFGGKADVLGFGLEVVDTGKKPFGIFGGNAEGVFRSADDLEILRRDLVDLFVGSLCRKHYRHQKLERGLVVELRSDVGICLCDAFEGDGEGAFVHHVG